MASFPGGMVQQGMQNRGMTQPQVQRPQSPGYTPQALNRPAPQVQPMRPYDQWAAQQNNPAQPQTSQPQVMPPRPPMQPPPGRPQGLNPPPPIANHTVQQPQVQRPLQPAGRPQGQQAQNAYDQWAARQQGRIVSADRGMGQQQPQGNPFIQNSPLGQMMNRKGGARPSPPQSVYY